MSNKEIEIPELIQKNCRIVRGYPVPYVILNDDFKVNDERKRLDCLINNKCTICGTDLGTDTWLIAGPGSLFHPQGAVIEGFLHKECAVYSLQICPYLAYNIYNKKLDLEKLQKKHTEVILVDPTVELDRVPLFGLVKVDGFNINQSYNIIPNKPYLEVEFWNSGVKFQDIYGRNTVEVYLKEKYNVKAIY